MCVAFLPFIPPQPKGPEAMRLSCAWCLADIEHPDGTEDNAVSHGICLACLDNLEFQQGVPLTRFVEELPYPILLIHPGLALSAPNRMARQRFGESKATSRKPFSMQVYECAEARLPGGCRRRIPCTACAIRQSVVRTFETGEPELRVPAALKPSDPDRVSFIHFLVSTIKVGPMVLLRLEPHSRFGETTTA